MITTRFDLVTTTMPSDADCVNRLEVLQFAMWNHNGVVPQWNRACDEISALVEAGKVPSGWLVAYGSYADFDYKRVRALLERKNFTRSELRLAIDGLARQIDKMKSQIRGIK